MGICLFGMGIGQAADVLIFSRCKVWLKDGIGEGERCGAIGRGRAMVAMVKGLEKGRGRGSALLMWFQYIHDITASGIYGRQGTSRRLAWLIEEFNAFFFLSGEQRLV